MKRLFTILLMGFISICHSNITLGQTVQTTASVIINNIPPRTVVFNNNAGMGKMNSCATDSINYVFNKSTGFSPLTLNNTSSGNAFAQWYPAPQTLTVSGFEFFAWQSLLSSAVVSITCRMYNSTTDSFPTGLPLASVTVLVDSTFGGGLLSVLRKRAIFQNPVITSAPYVLTLETNSSTNVAVVANNWNATPPNGRSEWLSSVRIGTTYFRSYNINIGGPVFNADFIIQPYVSYNFTAGFSSSSSCVQIGIPITFTNTSSPVLFSRFYSTRAFFNIPQYSCIWDYGDTTVTVYSVDGNHTYIHNATYKVTLKDSLYGWTTGCGETYSSYINQSPTPTVASSNSPLCVGATLRLTADTIPGVTYYWTGPNGFTSNQQNPVINNASISMIGNYSVVTVNGQCSSTVAQTYVNVVSSFSAGNNGPLCAGQTLNLNATSIVGATYVWSGPNSFSSNLQNPSKSLVTKSDSGLYSLTISLNGCGTLGPFTTLLIVNAVPSSPIVGSNSPLCVGDNIILTASTYAGGTYNWSGPNNYASTQQNPVRPSALNTYAGTYTVTITSNACVSPVGSTTVIINNIPATPIASNNGPLCIGQNLSLTANLISGVSYLWSGPNSFTSTTQNPIRSSLSLSDAGIYSVIAIINGCASTAANTNVVITTNTPAPLAGSNGPLCPGQSLQLTSSGISGATYSWVGPASFTSTSQNPVINGITSANAGIYSVTATTSSCGTSNAANINLIVNTLPAAPTASNNGPLCAGDSLHLYASNVTGAAYFWSGPLSFTSAQQNPVITNINSLKSGQYSVYVVVTGCGSSSVSNTSVFSHLIPNTPTAMSNAPLCAGDTLRLNGVANGLGPNAIYRWTGPNNFNSAQQNPFLNSINANQAGFYSLTVSDSGCTSNSGAVNVIIKPIPAAPVPGSNAPFCSGGNLNLSASPVSGASYLWTGPDNFSSFLQNPTLSGVDSKMSGTYSVKALVNGCSSIAGLLNVLIYNLPETPVASNDGPKCVGENVALNASMIVGATYSWSGPVGYSVSTRNATLTNTTLSMSGKYNVIAIADGCSSMEGSTTVVINPIPSAPLLSSNPSGYGCEGDSLQLFASFVNGGYYEWSGPAGFGSTKQNPVINNLTQANQGIYSASVSKAGCISPDRTINIAIYPKPQTSTINGSTNVKSAGVETYSVSGSAGSNFSWTVLGGTQTAGTNTSSISVLWGAKGQGTLTVKETNGSGCSGKLQSLSIVIGPVAGLNEDLIYSGQIKLFPNPAEKQAQLEFNYDKKRKIEMIITDLLGQAISERSTFVIDQHGMKILDLSLCKPGIYFINIMVEGQKGVIKLIVK